MIANLEQEAQTLPISTYKTYIIQYLKALGALGNTKITEEQEHEMFDNAIKMADIEMQTADALLALRSSPVPQ